MRQLTFDDPPAQRHSRTSREAAEAIREHALTLRERVYWYIVAHGPCTDEEIALGLELNPSTARPRRIELVAEGLVRAAPETKRTLARREATAWVSTEPF